MSVYTRVEADDLCTLLADYAVGELEDFTGISAGITNTNYFVDTSLGRWVLTLFEQVDETELPFFMQLMDHLAGHGVPCAHPVARNDGGFLSRVRGRPAALVYRLNRGQRGVARSRALPLARAAWSPRCIVRSPASHQCSAMPAVSTGSPALPSAWTA